MGAAQRGTPQAVHEQRRGPVLDGLPVPAVRLHGRARHLRADRRRARCKLVHADQHAVADRTALPRHRFRDAACGPVLPAGRRADGFLRRRLPDDPAVADPGRPLARRARAGGDAVQHVLRRHLGLVGGRRRRPDPHRRAGNGQGRLRPRIHGRAHRLRVDDGEPDPTQHHGRGLRRHRQRLDRRPVSRRCRARRADRHRPDDLQLFLGDPSA